MTVAVIADIVGSRLLADRAGAQRAIEHAVARAESDVPLATQGLAAVVGDELQGEYPRVGEALAGLLLIRLALPDGVDCRFGLGVGQVRPLDGGVRRIPEGPAWWAARDAIEQVERLQQRAAPFVRTRVALAEGEDASMTATVALANAYALSRDQIVSAMTERTRRLTYGRCLGRSQRELAADEGITQSAVSQALASAGAAAVVEGFGALIEGSAS